MSVSAIAFNTNRTNFPAANVSAWPSRARSSTDRQLFSPTSPPAQIRSNPPRSTVTAVGVIIGIIAVTLIGTAVNGISIGFDKSMAVLGDDVLYVTQWPWKPVDDWWNYRDRKKIKTEYAETL